MTALCRAGLLLLGCVGWICAGAQRTYKAHSVLAAGTWYRVAVSTEGVYRMDGAFLAALGLGANLPAGALRVYGATPGMLPESNSAPRIDDLEELAITVADGGDGVINSTDVVYFYSPGPHPWKKDSVNRSFQHTKNLYSDVAYYYLTVGGTGKRVATGPVLGGGQSVTSFDERVFYEKDSVNFLSSGREWFGEEFSALPGRALNRTFTFNVPGALAGTQAALRTRVAARSIGVTTRFDISLNGQPALQVGVFPVTGVFNDLFAQQTTQTGFTILSGGSGISLAYNYVTNGSFNAQGWLDWLEVVFRRSLAMAPGQQLQFRDWSTVGTGNATFRIGGAAASTTVWDVTDPFNAVRMPATLSAAELSFTAPTERLREYVAFGTDFGVPVAAGAVPNQDLHGSPAADFLVVTHPDFLPQANAIAAFHRQRDGLQVLVVTTDQVFREFGGSTGDPTAIRDFAKMFYDRQRATWGASGKYLLLLGRGSFDYRDRVRNNTNFVPVWESPSSLDPLSTYASDDFFGFLDDNEDIHSLLVPNTLDIGIGRIPVRNATEAGNFVAKLLAYHSPAGFGPWRNNATFVADDGDQNLHLEDAEVMASTTKTQAPFLNQQKIYLDAYRREGGTAGGAYPQANAAINNNILAGALIWNYSGHGGYARLAEETIADQDIVNNWKNQNRLPLFITATCDFAPYDLPGINSLGENLLVRPQTGAIALMTTSRVVFAYSNRVLNNNYLQTALQPDASGRYKTLGEAVQASKNLTYLTNGDVNNNRKFALLGDPAMTLGFPKGRVRPLLVNGHPIATADTLNATEFAEIEGEVTNAQGTRLTDFNGNVWLTLFDKPQVVRTLGNTPASPPTSFQQQTASLFRGRVTASGGRFKFSFRVPRDINFQHGAGRMSFYAQDSTRDAGGVSNSVIIGGIVPGASDDKEGPQIRAFLNDERFVSGSVTDQNPVLLLRLADSSGINTGNAGIDHDIVVTVDGNNRNYYVLNDFYETEPDTYQRGRVRFQLPAFTPGKHTLTIKAWDVLNNSSTYTLDFTVAKDKELVLDHVLNYPNPFTTKTQFWFEHNKPGIDLNTRVEIFTVTGRLIKTLRRTINNDGNRSSEVEWDGADDFGARVGRGVYIYRLVVESGDGKKATQLQKLVIL
ncbi:type IX secretion system sortase PorU [Flaviaesturariibacter flavus]|uniref:Type IX secretion system sortase PorU n=1 Tax=Flaviaesturariibacter flavus TaxID=2502780 RepID=A0A4R1B597_9BACT|nr:type IX secretion system sortase PorU [Flaviaesturariibacter flavus]TCJ13304.1 type IX secretion system sortase PorU [Flaviaesturariibacter flavus]